MHESFVYAGICTHNQAWWRVDIQSSNPSTLQHHACDIDHRRNTLLALANGLIVVGCTWVEVPDDINDL